MFILFISVLPFLVKSIYANRYPYSLPDSNSNDSCLQIGLNSSAESVCNSFKNYYIPNTNSYSDFSSFSSWVRQYILQNESINSILSEAGCQAKADQLPYREKLTCSYAVMNSFHTCSGNPSNAPTNLYICREQCMEYANKLKSLCPSATSLDAVGYNELINICNEFRICNGGSSSNINSNVIQNATQNNIPNTTTSNQQVNNGNVVTTIIYNGQAIPTLMSNTNNGANKDNNTSNNGSTDGKNDSSNTDNKTVYVDGSNQDNDEENGFKFQSTLYTIGLMIPFGLFITIGVFYYHRKINKPYDNEKESYYMTGTGTGTDYTSTGMNSNHSTSNYFISSNIDPTISGSGSQLSFNQALANEQHKIYLNQALSSATTSNPVLSSSTNSGNIMSQIDTRQQDHFAANTIAELISTATMINAANNKIAINNGQAIQPILPNEVNINVNTTTPFLHLNNNGVTVHENAGNSVDIPPPLIVKNNGSANNANALHSIVSSNLSHKCSNESLDSCSSYSSCSSCSTCMAARYERQKQEKLESNTIPSSSSVTNTSSSYRQLTAISDPIHQNKELSTNLPQNTFISLPTPSNPNIIINHIYNGDHSNHSLPSKLCLPQREDTSNSVSFFTRNNLLPSPSNLQSSSNIFYYNQLSSSIALPQTTSKHHHHHSKTSSNRKIGNNTLFDENVMNSNSVIDLNQTGNFDISSIDQIESEVMDSKSIDEDRSEYTKLINKSKKSNSFYHSSVTSESKKYASFIAPMSPIPSPMNPSNVNIKISRPDTDNLTSTENKSTPKISKKTILNQAATTSSSSHIENEETLNKVVSGSGSKINEDDFYDFSAKLMNYKKDHLNNSHILTDSIIHESDSNESMIEDEAGEDDEKSGLLRKFNDGSNNEEESSEISEINSMSISMTGLSVNRNTKYTSAKIPLSVMAVVQNFEPRMKDELKLEVNDRILLLKVFDDGWAVGLNQMTGKQGVFPMEYVISSELIKSTNKFASQIEFHYELPNRTVSMAFSNISFTNTSINDSSVVHLNDINGSTIGSSIISS